MRVLMINKFLHRNGGSETYIFKLGEALEQHGHEVQFFGMDLKAAVLATGSMLIRPIWISTAAASCRS